MTMNQEAFEHEVRKFILLRLPPRDRPKGRQLGPGTALFDDGYISSKNVVAILAFLEKTLDISIPEDKLIMRYFRTIRAMWEAFGSDSKKASSGRP